MGDFGSVFIGRKDRIENFRNAAPLDDNRQPLEQNHPVEFKRREAQSRGERQIRVAQNLERQMESLGELLLIRRGLRAETEGFRAQRTQLRVTVVE